MKISKNCCPEIVTFPALGPSIFILEPWCSCQLKVDKNGNALSRNMRLHDTFYERRFTYDKSERLCEVHSPKLLLEKYTYNDDGQRIAALHWKDEPIWRYIYDEAGRCIQAGPFQMTYGVNGNHTSRTFTGNPKIFPHIPHELFGTTHFFMGMIPA